MPGPGLLARSYGDTVRRSARQRLRIEKAAELLARTEEPCRHCVGGQRACPRCKNRNRAVREACGTCLGTGKVTCGACKGTGTIKRHEH